MKSETLSRSLKIIKLLEKMVCWLKSSNAVPVCLFPWQHQIITHVWDSEAIPLDWNDAILLPFFKKGNKCCCSNYQGINLTDIATSLLSHVTLKVSQQTQSQKRPNQCEFHPSHCCIDQIFTLRQLFEHHCCYQKHSRLLC